jgi:hypothetical protein
MVCAYRGSIHGGQFRIDIAFNEIPDHAPTAGSAIAKSARRVEFFSTQASWRL